MVSEGAQKRSAAQAPRFAGATFGDVARGLFRPAREPRPAHKGDGECEGAEEVSEEGREAQAR